MKAIDIFSYIASISPILLTIGIVLGIFLYGRLNVKSKFLLYYLILALYYHILGETIGKITGNNLIFILLYSFVELLLFTVLYLFLLKTEKTRKLIVIIGTVGLSYILYEIFTVNTINYKEFQSYARSADAFIIVLYSMVYFFVKLSKGTNPADSTLKLNTGLLLYFSLNLILYLPINFLINDSTHLMLYFWYGNMFLTLIFYVFIIHLIWKNGKIPKHLRSGLE